MSPGRRVIYPGSDLLSHAVASAVPSAQEGLTSVFGMGTGVAPPAMPPGIESNRRPSGAGQPNPEILECNDRDAHLSESHVLMSSTWSSRTGD